MINSARRQSPSIASGTAILPRSSSLRRCHRRTRPCRARDAPAPGATRPSRDRSCNRYPHRCRGSSPGRAAHSARRPAAGRTRRSCRDTGQRASRSKSRGEPRTDRGEQAHAQDRDGRRQPRDAGGQTQIVAHERQQRADWQDLRPHGERREEETGDDSDRDDGARGCGRPSLGRHGFGHRPTLAEGDTHRSGTTSQGMGVSAVVRRPRLDEIGRRVVDRRECCPAGRPGSR